jgi:thiamine biosynthesis protein ThiI
MSKVEITDESRRIGTYEISIRPHEDCCSFLVAKHPETKASLSVVLEAEAKVDLEAGVEAALAAAETHRISPE